MLILAEDLQILLKVKNETLSKQVLAGFQNNKKLKVIGENLPILSVEFKLVEHRLIGCQHL